MSPLTLYTIRHLTGRPLSTTFALLSMALVSFALASLSSIGVGIASVFQTDESESLVMVRARDADSEWTSSVLIEDVNRVMTREGVTRRSVEKMLVSALVPGPGEPVDYLQIRGLDPSGFDLHAMKIVAGRMPEVNAEEVVVGEAIYRHYPKRLAVGTVLEVHNKYKFTIVGVFRTRSPLDNELWTHRATLERHQNPAQRQRVNTVYLEMVSPQAARSLADTITHERGSRLDASISKEWRAKTASKGFKPLYRWLIIINVVVAFGVLLAAASQLTIVLLRRSADMTVLRVLGFTFARVVVLVVVEVQILAIVGAGLGNLIAAVALRGVSLQASGPAVGVNFEPKLSLGIVAATFVVMIVIGLLAAAIPIVRLARSQLARELR